MFRKIFLFCRQLVIMGTNLGGIFDLIFTKLLFDREHDSNFTKEHNSISNILRIYALNYLSSFSLFEERTRFTHFHFFLLKIRFTAVIR